MIILGPAWRFLAEIARIGSKKSSVPVVRGLQTALDVAQIVIEHEVEAGRISQPDYYSKEIRKYEQSALGSSRII